MKTGKLALTAVLLGCLAMPASACRPFGSYQFVEDAEGGIWFTEGDNNAVSRMAPDGMVKAHELPTRAAEPSSLALDGEGRLWFVEMDAKKIGRLDKDGRIVEYPITDGHPSRIAVDRRGQAWFTQMSGNEGGGSGDAHAGHRNRRIAKVGRIDPKGVMHSYPVPEGWPSSIAFDAHNQTWVTLLLPGDKPKGSLARLTREGRWNIVATWNKSCPTNLTRLPDGGLAFSDSCRFVLGHVAEDGRISERKLPENTYIQQMAGAPDGNLWFSGDAKGRLGRIGKNGKLNYLDRADSGDRIMALMVTRKGDVVFSEFYNYNINRLTKNGEYVEHLISADTRKSVREVKEGEVCFVEFAAQIASKEKMDKQRAEEVKSGRFKPDGAGTEQLVGQKCLICHDSRRLLLSRRSDWTPSITRMHAYREVRNFEPLTAEESTRLITYFNTYYGLKR